MIKKSRNLYFLCKMIHGSSKEIDDYSRFKAVFFGNT